MSFVAKPVLGDSEKKDADSVGFRARLGINDNEHDSSEKTKRTTSLGFPCLASLTLAACGGGGGGGDANVQPTLPNRAPVPATDKTVTLDEDAIDQALSITAPTDPDGGNLIITVTAVPGGGTLTTVDGAAVASSASLTITQLTGLVFTPVDIFRGEKSVLNYLLQPVKKVANEAFRER